MVLLQRKHTFLRIQSWSNIFPGGGGGSNILEGGGVQLLSSMETHITCDFPGRVWTPFPSGSAHGTDTCTSQEAGTVCRGNEAT